jgi:sterol O-acyltransferase
VEDFDDQPHEKPINVMLRRRSGKDMFDDSGAHTPEIVTLDAASHVMQDDSSSDEATHPARLKDAGTGKKTYVIASNDTELREILRRGLERVCVPFPVMQ